jgi:hypothetical protein
LPSDTPLLRKDYDMALIGTLKGFGVTDIFQLISQQIKTGLLILSTSKETITVAFSDGIIQGISSDKWEFDPRTEILLKGNFVNEKEKKARATGMITLYQEEKLKKIYLIRRQLSFSGIQCWMSSNGRREITGLKTVI